LEGGASGAGKTDWQRWIAYQLLLQGYEVYICDMKGYSFAPFEGLVTIADDLKSCRKILLWMVKELERRKAVIQSREFGNREDTIATFKPIVVLIDEAADLSPSQYAAKTTDKEWAFDCDYAIGFIGRKGREPKVFCIYGTQRPDARVINKQFKDNVEASIAFRTKDHYGSQIIIDRPGAEKIDPKDKGRCIYSHGEDILVQTPFIGGDKEWEKLLAPLKKGMIIENGNSKRTNKERNYTEGSFTSTDSANRSDSKTIHLQLKSAKESFTAPSGPAPRKTDRMGVAQKIKNMETYSQGPDDDEWI
jgi:DNA segregation ATPase FtsK/SpoIIIE-like protein